MKKAEEIIRQYIGGGVRAAVALSGGVDSMVLLDLMLNISEGVDFTLVAIHINHGLRGRESDGDEAFVREYCAAKGIECYVYRLDIKSGGSIEQEARRQRYEAFERAVSEHGLDYILLAHHQADQAETVLINILRGSGTAGARGMGKCRDGKFLRPLLYTEKKTVDDYAKKRKIPFVTDSSNLSDDFDRNYLRHRVFPLLNERWSAERNIASFSECCRQDDDFIGGYVPKLIAEDGEVHLQTALLEAHYAVASRYVLSAARALNIAQDFAKENIDAVIALKDKQTGREIMLKNGYSALREYDEVIISKAETERAEEKTAFSGTGEYKVAGHTVRVSKVAGLYAARGGIYLDAHKIPDGAVFRTRREGDIFEKYGGGRRKLKEYFIDCKVPKRQRDSIPLLASQSNILAVCGMEIADPLKITEETKEIFCFMLIGEEK